MAHELIPSRDRSIVMSLSSCAVLALVAGTVVAAPDEPVTPVKINELEGGNGDGPGDRPGAGEGETRVMPSRGPSRRLRITGLDQDRAVGMPEWVDSLPQFRLKGPHNAAALNAAKDAYRYDIESKVVVEVADRQTLEGALAGAGLLRNQNWLQRNVRPVAQSTTMFVVNFPTVRQAMEGAEKLLADARVIDAQVSQSPRRVQMDLPTDPFFDPFSPNTYPYFFDNSLNPQAFVPGQQDHGLIDAYDLGYTGQGVIVGVLEAFDYSYQAFTPEVADLFQQLAPMQSHPDLLPNHDQSLSQLYNPFTQDIEFGHGNAVAALIAAENDNGEGAAGVAYDATLVGLTNGPSLAQAEAFMWRNDVIRIKNHSWGFPTLLGTASALGAYADSVADAPSYQGSPAGRALRGSATDFGVINVMSAGNNGIWAPNITPYFNNFLEIDDQGEVADLGMTDLASTSFTGAWTGVGGRTEYSATAKWSEVLAIGAVGEDNDIAGYSTTGTNVVASAYSQGFDNEAEIASPGSGASGERGIVTADAVDGNDAFGIGDEYQPSFNGTSAAAPIATGIIALMLEANPSLSIRDIKWILQGTSDWTRIPGAFTELADGTYYSPVEILNEWAGAPAPLVTLWQVNSGFQVHSDEYGFGIIDAEEAISAAESFGGAPPQVILDSSTIEVEEGEIPGAEYVDLGTEPPSESVDEVGSLTLPPICVRPNIYIEEVELTVRIQGGGAGDLMIGLQSGSGTYSTFAVARVDASTTVVDGQNYAYYDYRFNSLKHWGEYSGGDWQLLISDMAPDTGPTVQGDPDLGNAFAFFPPGTSVGVEPFYEQKILESYRLRIKGVETNKEPYGLCQIGTLSCPGDWDGDGNVTPRDLMEFIEAYLAGSFLADFNNDGFVDYDDLLGFYTLWQPGPCAPTNNPGNRRDAGDPKIIGIG
ncbi:MAG: S8 family serine peptidase [Phycisphaerales bacterium JB040]